MVILGLDVMVGVGWLYVWVLFEGTLLETKRKTHHRGAPQDNETYTCGFPLQEGTPEGTYVKRSSL